MNMKMMMEMTNRSGIMLRIRLTTYFPMWLPPLRFQPGNVTASPRVRRGLAVSYNLVFDWDS